jgi:molybdopterin molybdotransferase
MLIEAGTVTFSGARIKPGAPVTLGALGETPLLALPGNPAAAWIVFQVLATVWFHRRLGRTDPPPYLARRPARAGAAFAHGRDKTAFWPARISGTDPDGAMVVERLCPQRAAGPVDVAHADVLAVTRPWRDVAPGGVVEVMTWS